MRKSIEIMSWVVYKLSETGKADQRNVICGREEWDAMQVSRPGCHTLIQAGIQSEAEAEKLARGTSGDAKLRKTGSYVPSSRS